MLLSPPFALTYFEPTLTVNREIIQALGSTRVLMFLKITFVIQATLDLHMMMITTRPDSNKNKSQSLLFFTIYCRFISN